MVKLSVRKLTRRGSNATPLLDNINFELASGERIALTGPNGSGKSLLFRSLVLLDAIDDGEIRLNDRLVTTNWIREFRTRLMYIPQRCVLLPGTVRENLVRALQLSIHIGRELPTMDYEAVLTELGLAEELLDRDSTTLSGGELQIVNLLRAVQLRPQILLLDEPTAALSPTTSLKVEEWLNCWRSTDPDRSWIWISHDERQVARISSAVWCMESGRLSRGRLSR